jgi:hypothetical protein
VKVLEMDLNGVATLEINIEKVGVETIQHSEIHSLRAFESQQIYKFIESAGGLNINLHNGLHYEEHLEAADWRFAVSYQI